MSFLLPAGGATVTTPTATVSFEASPFSQSSTTDYSGLFDAVAIGTAAADRKIVVGIAGSGGTIGRFVNTVDIVSPSVSLTNRLEIQSSGTGVTASFFDGIVSSGTSVDIDIVFDGAQSRVGIGVWAVYGATSTAHDTATHTGSEPLDADIDIPANGVCLAVVAAVNSSVATSSWTNLTENYDQHVETNHTHSGASDAFSTLQTGLTITDDLSVGHSNVAMSVISYGPA